MFGFGDGWGGQHIRIIGRSLFPIGPKDLSTLGGNHPRLEIVVQFHISSCICPFRNCLSCVEQIPYAVAGELFNAPLREGVATWFHTPQAFSKGTKSWGKSIADPENLLHIRSSDLGK